MLLKQKKANKLSTNFQPEPYEIVERKGNSMMIQSSQKSQRGQYHRNVAEVKKFNSREEPPDKSSDHEEESPMGHHNMDRRPQRNRHPPDRYGKWTRH